MNVPVGGAALPGGRSSRVWLPASKRPDDAMTGLERHGKGSSHPGYLIIKVNYRYFPKIYIVHYIFLAQKYIVHL